MAEADPPPLDSPAGQRFTVLDSWRGLAALAVALSHIQGTGPLLSGPLHGQLPLAVDFFFVLSGFVIAASYGARLAQGFSLPRYMGLRLARLWPLHAALVLAYVGLEAGLAWWGGGGLLAGREPFTGPRDPAALPVVLLLLQAWVWPGRDLWNVQSWSISVEIGLYLLSALAWRWLGARANLLALAPALAALAALYLGLAPQWEPVLRGVAGFALGMACWRLWCRWRAVALPPWAIALGELATLPAILLGMAFQAPYVAMDMVFAATILLFAREEGPVSRWLSAAPFVWLGTLSYALYMVHGLVIGRAFDALALLQDKLGARWVEAGLGGGDVLMVGPFVGALVAGAMLALSVACAWLAWRVVEWPARQWSRKAFRRGN